MVKEIELFTPYAKQAEIIKAVNNFRFVCVNTGRQVGKTTLGWNLLIEKAANNPNTVNVWVSPFQKQLNKVFDTLVYAIEDLPIVTKISRVEKVITFYNNSKIKFFSAENHDAMRGETVNFVVCDEFAMYKTDAWDFTIRPTMVTKKDSKALLLSTPRGRGLWYDLCQMGKDPNNKNWTFLTAKSEESPLADQEFLQDAKKTMSESAYRQEFLAEFIENQGSLFSNIDQSLCLEPNSVTHSGLVAGIDVGFKNDFTVCTIFNDKFEMVDMFRKRDDNLDYRAMSKEIYMFLKKYNFPRTRIEINMHDSVYTFLKQMRVPRLEAYRTTAKTKKEDITFLSSLFASQQIKLLKDNEIENEVVNFGYEITSKGNIVYHATGNFHDDIVMSVAIALSQLKKPTSNFSITKL